MRRGFSPERFKRAKAAVAAWQCEDDRYRTAGLEAQLEELAVAAEYARTVIENGDPECEAAVAALEQGWSAQR